MSLDFLANRSWSTRSARRQRRLSPRHHRLPQGRLCELMNDERVQLPDCVFDYEADHYCRRLIHQDEQLGYTIMAMTWGPGQSTPVHDHAGMWCVEAVWHGQIEVVQYELIEREQDRFHLEPRTTMRTGVGSAGSLIPPHEYHTIANPTPKSGSHHPHLRR
jgi:3-mercaptopropionate dioxygenase